MALVAACRKSWLVLKSNPRVRWSPRKPRGSPKGKYHAVTNALANSGLPAHKSIGFDPQLYVGGRCCLGCH